MGGWGTGGSAVAPKIRRKAEWLKMEEMGGGRKSDIMTVMRAGFVKDYVLWRVETSFFPVLLSIQWMM